jgi:formate/nitrite transporter FocA (FNT family)
MYMIPLGLFLEGRPEVATGLDGLGALSATGFVNNLVPVTLGNIAGGTLLVAGIYWFIYLRPVRKQES